MLVVYYLHGQTARVTVWALCYAKFRTGKSYSPRNRVYHLNKSVPFTEKLPRTPGTGIKDGFDEWYTNLRFNTPFGKTALPFQAFRCSRAFPSGTTQKVLFHLLSDRIFRNFFKWYFPKLSVCCYCYT